jgi:cystathionine beta-lyase/cystathionine gamma-synthase
MSGFGGIVSFELHGDEQAGVTFIENLDLFALSISFGSVTSLVSFPARMSHKEMKREERIQRGFADSLVRLSLGIEHIDDIVGAIDNALDKV